MRHEEIELSTGEMVKMQCPTVKAVKKAFHGNKDEMDTTIDLIASTTNKTREEIESLSFPDYLILQEVLTGFLGKGVKSTPAE